MMIHFATVRFRLEYDVVVPIALLNMKVGVIELNTSGAPGTVVVRIK